MYIIHYETYPGDEHYMWMDDAGLAILRCKELKQLIEITWVELYSTELVLRLGD
jgi:hypothetical protein